MKDCIVGTNARSEEDQVVVVSLSNSLSGTMGAISGSDSSLIWIGQITTTAFDDNDVKTTEEFSLIL
jgi:hypothetical protein